ncbi:phospho-acceptor domain-containing protein [Leeuwenhoekiella aestuarii]|uniref:histidine kinase n=1 Tax=Leeuwenhoekiella aestuarii TaxID=2249426 RepID=A0A4Q0NW07_9FLAO|nr:ATP-binding protein [Leeuwenhoekiella aestuarii]RXG15486.1 phospho-acceptor domain-containing protein [Leeuwenhoekiella aestuarii]RXG17407.1 phospho-acceptor domain-containing protein [Leeuwenhoekiella aestuarii]
MNPLLKRQIRKHLQEEGIVIDEKFSVFLNAVSSSYANYEEQLLMVQRAMSLSSDELVEANKNLKKESTQQREIIDSLTQTIAKLQKYGNAEELPKINENKKLDGLELARVIESQTREIINSNQQRQALLEKLEKQNKELNDYAHVVSHDLKSPLNNINALTNFILEDGNIDEDASQNLNLILEHVEHMHSLIEGILEYSAVDKADGDSYTVDLDILVKNLLATMHIPENFEVEIQKELPLVEGNSFRFQQLFQNLIQNAIQYNDKELGHIAIGFEDEVDYFKFSIKDNGKGIEKQYHDKIFQVFQTLEDASKSKGIGLSIVSKIIKFYGGKIWLESQTGEGTTFYFTIPKYSDG